MKLDFKPSSWLSQPDGRFFILVEKLYERYKLHDCGKVVGVYKDIGEAWEAAEKIYLSNTRAAS